MFLKTWLIHLVIPNTWTLTWTWTWTWSVNDAPELNLVFQMSDVRYEIKTSLPVIWTEILTEKSGPVHLNEHEHKLILVPGWSGRWWRCWRTPGPQTSGPPTDNVRSKEMEEYYYSSDRSIITSYLLYTGLAIEFLMWSQITFLLSIRLTGGQQIDFKVFKPLKANKNIFRS